MTTTTRTITAIIDTDVAVLWGAGETRAEAERIAREYAASENLTVEGWFSVAVEWATVPSEMTPGLEAALRARIESITGRTGTRALDALRGCDYLAMR